MLKPGVVHATPGFMFAKLNFLAAKITEYFHRYI